MEKVELLLPAGNAECLRAAVNNGADSVYLGLNGFNARQGAENFDEKTIFGAIKYCHDRNVRVYVALNTLVKNDELGKFLELVNLADSAMADAIIIQDVCLIPVIKKNFPGLPIHLSTQATTTNGYSIPRGVDRVILARELSFEEIKKISKHHRTEIFIHGALCFCYSGQCLFSSLAGGRSGNRGKCAQPCRKMYNRRYLLSAMDLCLLERIPELIKAGVFSFKVEGRLRSPLYVGTVARIYRNYIDEYHKSRFCVEKKDKDDLKVVFNREFTEGYGFTDSIVDSSKPMNRGLYVGEIKNNFITLKKELKTGDGVGIWTNNRVTGQIIEEIIKEGKKVEKAVPGETVELRIKSDGSIYKTSDSGMKVNLGSEIGYFEGKIKKRKIILPDLKTINNNDKPRLFVKLYNKKSAIEAEKAGADVIYYDVLKKDCPDVRKEIKNSRFFVFTPRILSDRGIENVVKLINRIKPNGVLVGNRGLLKFLRNYEIHLDYSFNCFNDIDLNCYPGIPIISPELNFKEIISLKNKRFIVMAHGDIVLMTAKEKIKAPELIDEEGRHFKVRKNDDFVEILNCKQLGLFNKLNDYARNGIKYFYIDLMKDVGKYVRIYRKIINKEKFDDSKIRKGYTTGQFSRGVE
ncbi:U32 family peptidase [Candidatus Woesearchaeota archaeon]|nr:U32 family peptidase [Candidatus Woesearchaeota archaeon]